MLKRLLLIAFLVLAIPVWALAGVAHYVDCSLSDPETTSAGTFANPFRLMSEVNAHAMSTGDDVYFKVGTTCTADARLDIDWDGSSVDHVVIGAYYGDGEFGLNGNARPIIDGNSNTVPGRTTDQGLINKQSGTGYIDVKDLKITNSGCFGIIFKDIDHVIVENCWLYRSWKSGIWIGRTSDIDVDQNLVNENCQDNYQAGSDTTIHGGALVVAGVACGTTYDVSVSRNTIYNNHCTETLSFNRCVSGIIAERNVIYDNHKLSLYLDAVKNAVVRYNLIYSSSDAATWSDTRPIPNGIEINNEPYGYCFTGNHEIYGNLIASMSKGISFGSDVALCYQSNNLIYNNDFIDQREASIYFWSTGDEGSGNVIKNNISWTYTGDGVHTNSCSASGFTWNYNLWDDDPGTGNCDAANDPANTAPGISKTSAWRTITAGALNASDFALTSLSPAIDVGDSAVTGYTLLHPSSVFVDNVQAVENNTGSGPEIGAFVWLTSSDDDDSDGISNACETDAGTNTALATDNDTEAEKVQTLISGADAVPDGNCTIADMGSVDLTGLISSSIGAYETAIQGGSYSTPPTLSELQGIIDTVNAAGGSASTNDTSVDANCIVHFPLDTNANDDQGGTALTFNNSAAISNYFLELENAPADQDQNASITSANLPAGMWGKTGGSSDGTVCVTFVAETVDTQSYLACMLNWTTEDKSWALRYHADNLITGTFAYNNGISEVNIYHGTPIVAGEQYTVCMSYDVSDDAAWIRVRDAYGNIHGVDLYDSDVLPAEATFNLEDSNLYIGSDPYDGHNFDGKLRDVAVWNIGGNDFLSVHATQWALGTFARDTGGVCQETPTYAPSLTGDIYEAIADAATQDFIGFKYTPASNQTVCKVDVNILDVLTDPTGNKYYLAVYALDGSGRLNTLVGLSDAVDGGALAAGWNSFAFSTPISLTSGTAYGGGWFLDTDSNTTDDPEVDATNSWRPYWDNNSNVDAILGGRYRWTWDAALPYEVEGSDALDDMVIRVYTTTDADPVLTAVTLGAPGLITTPDGTCTYAADTTASWTDTTVRYFGVPISGALTITGVDGWPTIPLLAGPATTDITYAYYHGQCIDAGAQRYVVFKYTPDAGDRISDLLLNAASIDCDKNDDGLNDASAIDTNYFDMCSAENNALTSADLSGTGTIDINIPFTSTTPLTVGTFTGTDTETLEEFEYQGVYADYAAWVTAGGSNVGDDFMTFGTFTSALNATGAGTAGHPVTVTFFDPTRVATGAWTLDENYWTIDLNGGSIVGSVTVSGTNVEIYDGKITGSVIFGKKLERVTLE